MFAPSSTIAVVVAVGGLLLFPAAATAQRCTGEDVAAIDQYCESVAVAEGRMPIDGSGKPLESALDEPAAERLRRAGPAGRALLRTPLGALSSPDGLGIRRLPGATEALAGSLKGGSSLDRSVRAISTAANGHGLSDVFRWSLVLSTLGIAGAAWRRRRGGTGRALGR